MKNMLQVLLGKADNMQEQMGNVKQKKVLKVKKKN